MLPVVALVGRTNVGKSSLFNYFTHTRHAIVADYEGLTRDRQYGYSSYQHKDFIVVDTGGIGDPQTEIDQLVEKQCDYAIAEADVILFLVDAATGIVATEQHIADKLRKVGKPVILVINKVDTVNIETTLPDFYAVGYRDLFPISVLRKTGMMALLECIVQYFPSVGSVNVSDEAGSQEQNIKIAIVGKPNVGKSTLVNRLLGEERVIVSDQPGTTRDSIFIPFERQGQHYTLIDTAGIRRRKHIEDKIEKFSIVKALQAIDAAHVVLFLMDAQNGIKDQDLKLLGLVLYSGRGVVVVVNKWDNLSDDQKWQVEKELDRRLGFLDFAKKHFISALHGTGVGDLFPLIKEVYDASMQLLSTPQLTRILQQLVNDYEPPLVHGRRIKLQYAHAGGHNPPVIVIHGHRLQELPGSYQRYLENGFRQILNLTGTPIQIVFK
jgi:GTPase